MSRLIVRRLLQSTVALCLVGVLVLLFPLVLGSAEAFPTAEQEGKVRIAAGFLILLLAATAGASLLALKRLKS